MKKLITCTIIACFATIGVSFAGPDKAAIEAKEKTAWQTYKDKKPDDFKKVVDKDLRCVYSDGVRLMKDELNDMPKWDIKSFTISDFDTFTDEPDVVVATYKVVLDATFEGKDMSGTYNAGTVWKAEKGAWLAIFHTHAKVEAAK